MSFNDEEMFEKALSLASKNLFDESIFMFKLISSNLRAKINICVIHDWKKNCENLKNELPNPIGIESDDYMAWYYLGFLFHKINEFDKAIFCLNKCLELKHDFILALIKKGYSLEGAEPHRLDEAINCFKYILSLDTEDVKKNLGEIYHGLGHFLAENDKTRDGIDTMKKAIIEDVGYLPCYGTIHSEAKKYSQAVEIFDDVFTLDGLTRIYGNSLSKDEIKRRLKRIHEKNDLKNEIIFYRGDANWGLGLFEKARDDFETFADYCREIGNSDGLSHAQLYIVKTFLKEKNIFLLRPEDLKKRLDILEKNRFSLYANRYIHRDWEKTIKILTGLLYLSDFLSKGKIEDLYEVECIADSLINVFPNEKLEVVFVSDKPWSPPFKHDFINFTSPDNASDFSFILILLRDILPTTILSLIYKNISSSSIFILCGNPDIDIFSSLDKKSSDILLFSDIEEAKCALLLIGAYEKIKCDLLETVFLFGLTPTTEAPSFSAQTGVLPLLPYKNGSD